MAAIPSTSLPTNACCIRSAFFPVSSTKVRIMERAASGSSSEKAVSAEKLNEGWALSRFESISVEGFSSGSASAVSCISCVICASSAAIWPSFKVSNSSFTVKGLCRHPAKPCSCNAFSSISLRAVTAITGILRAWGILEARNNFTRSKPLMAGICISVSSTSKVEERNCSVSSSNCSQQTASMPCCFSMAAVRFSWILSSSIRSTRITFIGGITSVSSFNVFSSEEASSPGTSAPAGIFLILLPKGLFSTIDLPTGKSGNTTVKQLPFPKVLCTSMVPSSRRTNLCTIDNPSPNPSSPCAPGRRVNSWKIRSRSSDAMPFPVSETAMVSFEAS